MTGRRWALPAIVALVVAACGDSGGTPFLSTTTQETTTTVVTSTSTGDTTTTSSGGVTSLEDVRGAVVQVVAQGTFTDPFEGLQSNVAGSGSAFIIDPSGLAVTNNHVVTGAAVLEVYLDGESRPRNARVVGVSECSDLAVIDIAGDGYPALQWYEGPVTAGMSIFAAGFPLGDPEYTVLDGVVSKEEAFGDTTWASIDSVIEHSADTLPGNSGGPIVTPDGQVVAVNYAGNFFEQSFAIGRDVARPVVERLAAGENLDTIGINGEAYFDGSFGGIWVYSVQSGSPADRAGVEPGDLIITMENLDLGFDETMATYCDVLRSHAPTDVMAIEVYRGSVDAIFAGELNGTPLEETFSFEAEVDETIDPSALPPGTPYSEYTEATDDSGRIVVTVPVEWVDVNGVPWTVDDVLVGPALSVAPDLDAFFSTWGTPGVFIGASTELTETIDQLLDREDFSGACDFEGRLDYDDGFYTGLFDIWTNCGDENSEFLVIAAEPPEGDYKALVQILIATQADWDAADRIMASFFLLEAPTPP